MHWLLREYLCFKSAPPEALSPLRGTFSQERAMEELGSKMTPFPLEIKRKEMAYSTIFEATVLSRWSLISFAD